MRSIYTLFCCLVMFLTSSQLSATSFEVVNTGSNMTVFVIPGATMSGDVANVSEIGIFYTNDSGDLVCAGASSFSNDGSPFQITLWGSEAGEDNGMSANEVFTWKAQSADGAEYDVTPSYSVEGSDVYQLNGFTAVNGLAFTATSIEPEPIVGCMDANASNFNVDATEAGFDQYGNSVCVYVSCEDIPTWGCIYADGFGTFNADFSAAQCSQYGGSPCEEPVVGTPGCMDANASNFNADATEAGFDQYGNSLCVYASCDDIPEYGCIYGNGFGPFNADFSAAQCSDYGGSPCEEPVVAEAAPLFFSEYAEGSSNNKYLEIYNPTSETVDLAGYAFPSVSNAPTTVGVHEYWNAFTEGASIAAGGVYVIAHGSSDPAILAEADQTHNYLSNGDDGYALAFGSEEDHILIDVVGDFNGDPGSAWDVAGVSGATKDHTLVRKFSVTQGNTDWSASAGTNADDSEWLVFDQNTWTYLGSHEEMSDDIPGCTDELAFNYDANATSDDGSCVAVVSGCTDADASNYNGDANTSDDSCISWADLAASLQSQLAAIVPEDGITQADVDAQADLSYGYGYGDGAASVTPEDGISQADVDSVQALLDAIVPEDGVSQADVDAQADLSYGYGYGDGAASVTPEDGISQADVDSVQALLDAVVPEDGVSQADVDAQADLSYGYGYGDGAASVTPEDGVSQADVDSVEVLLAAALESACSPIFVDIVAGWNILGYTLPVAQDVAATLNSIEANILIVKDNNAEVYWPEFGFNGIGSFIPGQGYQIKTDAAIADYTWPSTDERISMSSSVPQWAVDMEVDVHPNDIKSLVKVVNMLGQEINVEDQFKGEVVLYLYNDGTVEKKIVQ